MPPAADIFRQGYNWKRQFEYLALIGPAMVWKTRRTPYLCPGGIGRDNNETSSSS